MSSSKKILTMGLSPAIQKTVIFKNFMEGDVNRSEHYYTDASGKCINSARVLTQAGMKTTCLTIAGKENKSEFESLCERDGIETEIVEIQGRVRICTTIINEKSGSCTEMVVNEPEEISNEEENQLLSTFTTILNREFDAAIISGSRLKGFSHKIIPPLIEKLKQRNVIIFADYKGQDLLNSCISPAIRPDFIKINQREFETTFKETITKESSLNAALQSISMKYQNTIIISRGDASTLISDRGNLEEMASSRIKAINTIGCGDAMIAGLAQGIIEGKSIIQAITLGKDYATRNALSIHPGSLK